MTLKVKDDGVHREFTTNFLSNSNSNYAAKISILADIGHLMVYYADSMKSFRTNMYKISFTGQKRTKLAL